MQLLQTSDHLVNDALVALLEVLPGDVDDELDPLVTGHAIVHYFVDQLDHFMLHSAGLLDYEGAEDVLA